MKKNLLLIIFSFLWLGCEKPLKTPENMDTVYNELSSQISKIDGEIAANESLISEKKTDMEKAEPQSGRFDYLRKKYWGALSAHQKLKQKKLSLEIALQLRKKATRIKYSEAFLKGEPWPPPLDNSVESINKRSLSSTSEKSTPKKH